MTTSANPSASFISTDSRPAHSSDTSGPSLFEGEEVGRSCVLQAAGDVEQVGNAQELVGGSLQPAPLFKKPAGFGKERGEITRCREVGIEHAGCPRCAAVRVKPLCVELGGDGRIARSLGGRRMLEHRISGRQESRQQEGSSQRSREGKPHLISSIVPQNIGDRGGLR